MSHHRLIQALALIAAAATGNALAAGPAAKDSTAILKASFTDKGQAAVERLNQTEAQRSCSEHGLKELPKALRAKLEKNALAEVKLPADDKYMGSWKDGEKIAQNGRGMQSSDDKAAPNGANCYACHQITKQEISFGNIGPSLAQYGKLRGGPTPEMLKYTWSKVYNSHSVNACSVMPRYGAADILTEKQIQDVVALLLDPESPVNK
jgi:sulfur-oxidizing protein SoxX